MDEKDIAGVTPEENADKKAVTEDAVAAALDGSSSYEGGALDEELSQLADLFRTELKKAQDMTEEELIENGILVSPHTDEEGVISEDDLCECCGERRRDKSRGENYEYCAECREAMRRYPISFTSIVYLAAVLFVAVVSVFAFSADFVKYNTVKQGDDYYKKNMVFTAADSYEGAISAFNDDGILAQKVYKKAINCEYRTMAQGVTSMNAVINKIQTILTPASSKLPFNKPYEEVRREMVVLYGTMQEFYAILEKDEYVNFNADDDKVYEQLMTEIGGIIDKQITVASLDGSESMLMDSSEAMVRFCQYMFAYSTGHLEDSYMYMKKVEELAPSYLWLYAYELGVAELSSGNFEKAEELAKALYRNNVEIETGYELYSSIYRMKGDYEKAVEWADKGLENIEQSSELYRIKAMALIAKGDFEGAKTATDTALGIDKYGLLYCTAIVVENELGNKETVKEMKAVLTENDIKLSDKMNDYLKGKISAKEMFTEGSGDVE